MTLTRFDRWAPHYDDAALQPLFRAAHDRVLQESAGMVAAAPVPGGAGGRCGRVRGHALGGRVGAAGSELAPLCARRSGTLPFADATFDLVLPTCSLRHWTDPDAGMREIGRVLARGGVVALADLFDSGPRTVIGSIAGRRPRVPPALQPCLAGANLSLINVVRAAGHGPIIEITVVLATRLPTAYAAGGPLGQGERKVRVRGPGERRIAAAAARAGCGPAYRRRPVGGAATCRSQLGLDEANADGVPGQFEPVAQAELL